MSNKTRQFGLVGHQVWGHENGGARLFTPDCLKSPRPPFTALNRSGPSWPFLSQTPFLDLSRDPVAVWPPDLEYRLRWRQPMGASPGQHQKSALISKGFRTRSPHVGILSQLSHKILSVAREGSTKIGGGGGKRQQKYRQKGV